DGIRDYKVTGVQTCALPICRGVEALLDAQVHQARRPAEVVEHAIGDLAIAGDVGAFDLDVDRRRQSEVEDLRHDVGGQEVEAQQIGRASCRERGEVQEADGG